MRRLRGWLRWPRRRPAMVLVPIAEYEQACEWAVIGEALEVLAAAERHWLLLDTEGTGPWDD